MMNYFFLFTYFGEFFLIKRNMNNITHKNVSINTNDLKINSFYNVLVKIIIFVINSIFKHLRIARSPYS